MILRFWDPRANTPRQGLHDQIYAIDHILPQDNMLTSPRVVSHFPSIGGGGGSTSTRTTNVTFLLANNGVSPCSISTVGHSYPPPKFLLGSSCCRTRCSHRISDQWSFHPLPGTFSFDIPHHRLETWNSYQQDLPVIAKRKLLIIGGARGLWSLFTCRPVKWVWYHRS